MASRRAAARAFASDMASGRFLKRGDAPVGPVRWVAVVEAKQLGQTRQPTRDGKPCQGYFQDRD